jgi:hypothetical protein
LGEGDNDGGGAGTFSVLVPFFGGVAKERGVSHVVGFLPVPVSKVPREVKDETSLENPVDGGFFTWGRQVSSQPEGRSVTFLGEHSNGLVSLQGDGNVVGAGG